MIKKSIVIAILGICFLASCSPVTDTKAPPTIDISTMTIYTEETPAAPDSPPTYSVTKSTGLYDAFDISANVKADLPTGAKLIPMNGATVLTCDSFVDTGITYELCKVEVVKTGQTGWVLKKWIAKD